jgi:hypothetical protein
MFIGTQLNNPSLRKAGSENVALQLEERFENVVVKSATDRV